MLPYFAAAGHNLYLKSSYLYLQQMTELKKTNPEVYKHFSSGNHVIRRTDKFWAGLSTDLVIEQVLMRSVKTVGGMTRGRGMSESQRAQWLLSMPACAEINNAMQEFTEQIDDSQEQHKDMFEARIKRDSKDRNTFLDYLNDRNPFADQNENSLRNIETGVLADSCVNVDNAKTIGLQVIEDMENKNVSDYVFRKKNQAVTLGSKHNIKVDGEEVHVDSQLLFQRLVAVSESAQDDVEDLFRYELCSHPSSLFDTSGLLRAANKPSLSNAIWQLGTCGVDEIAQENVNYVLDGGSLIHRIPWAYGAKFDSICEDYVNLVVRNYGLPHIVFDGYNNGPTTKDITHARRTKGIVGTRVIFDGRTTFKSKKDQFLSNEDNKNDFVNLLGTHLKDKGCRVTHAPDDTDVLIALTAVTEARNAPTIVIGEDTDVLVLLCYHAGDAAHDLYYTSDVKSGTKKKKIWDINKTRQTLGSTICRLLPVVHAFSGCDTTSHIYGVGKGVLLKKAIQDSWFRDQLSVFVQDVSHDRVENAGENIFVSLFSGDADQSLNSLRFQKFIYKVNTSSTCVQVRSLPPTEAAAMLHSFWVYLQVQTWIGKSKQPTEWGWCIQNGKLNPVKTHLPAAPERLLKIIHCNCKLNCDSKRCTCRKHGLPCSAGCGECRGIGCSNVYFIQDDTEID